MNFENKVEGVDFTNAGSTSSIEKNDDAVGRAPRHRKVHSSSVIRCRGKYCGSCEPWCDLCGFG